jgi:hypothetical protein
MFDILFILVFNSGSEIMKAQIVSCLWKIWWLLSFTTLGHEKIHVMLQLSDITLYVREISFHKFFNIWSEIFYKS